jgi:hypothetical protein
MKRYKVIGINECGEEFYADEIQVQLPSDDFTYDEIASMILDKRRASYREQYNEEIDVSRFYLEADFSTMSYSELMEYAEYHREEY